jgi:surfeit locus 1 family protein
MTAAARGGGSARYWTTAALLVAAIAMLMSLGVWQLQRRVWKRDLIAAVQARVHAAPVPAPGPGDWARIDAAHDAYRRVWARGTFLNDRETLVQAVTEKGAGFWVMTPLKTDRGFTLLVNRGFVPAELKVPGARRAGRIEGETVVAGLLRITEPQGGFLRRNAPAQARWYSRDVAAIARADGLERVAPYFIDADAAPNPGGWPLGGLTVIRFPNSHLVYALTWFGLAAMTAVGGWLWARTARAAP